MEIRDMNREDIPYLASFQQNDWSDIVPFFLHYLKSSNCYPVVVEAYGKLVGIGSGTNNGNMGWIGHIIVADKYKRKGIGRMLTTTIMKKLQEQGCTTLSLIASAEGEALYGKLGFQIVSSYYFYQSESLIDYKEEENVRKMKAKDIEEIMNLDYEATGEDRSTLIQRYGQQGWVIKDQSSRKVRGYYLPKLFEGPIIALDEEAGYALLRKKLSMVHSTVIPSLNHKGRKYVEQLGFTHKKTLNRMTYGEKLRWEPTNIYSRISGAFG